MEVKEERLKVITNLAEEMRDIELEIDKLKSKLDEKEKMHNQISAVELPELMAEIGLRQFTLSDGTKFAVVPVFKISVPKSKMGEANDWLIKHGHDGMVKTRITMPRGVPDYALNQIVIFIRNQGFLPETEKTIHPQTLGKWGREMETEGMVIPEDIFNIFRSNKTVIE